MAEPHTLLLTPWMTPHRIVTWQEAITLLYNGKVEVLETYEGQTISSPSVTIPMPSVARLIKPIAAMKKNVKFSRQNVLLRDNFMCQYCGKKAPMKALNYDHILPRSKGGKTTWLNIVTACYPCNTKKGDRSLKESGMVLLRPPTHPKSLPLSPPVSFKNAPPVWLTYGATLMAEAGLSPCPRISAPTSPAR